jgi:hypothetical protein
MCGAETVPVGDIANRAALITLEQDGEVEIPRDEVAERLRDACQGMGALLRFRLDARDYGGARPWHAERRD